MPQTLAREAVNNLNCGKDFGHEITVVADEGKRVEVVGYMRTSSASNVGNGKDSEARQRKAIEGYAQASGAVIVDWFYDCCRRRKSALFWRHITLCGSQPAPRMAERDRPANSVKAAVGPAFGG